MSYTVAPPHQAIDFSISYFDILLYGYDCSIRVSSKVYIVLLKYLNGSSKSYTNDWVLHLNALGSYTWSNVNNHWFVVS